MENKMNVNEINKQLSQQGAEWKCERGCDRPATHVIEWRHQDGDRERRILCKAHAIEDQKNWSTMHWDADVEVSNIEEWELSVSCGGKTVSRIPARQFRPIAPRERSMRF